MLRNRKEQKGFTLIELLVVIAIIGLLASVVLLSLNSARAKSRDAKRLADVRQVASAMELYFNDSGAYPSTKSDLVPNYIGVWPAYPAPFTDGSCTATIFPNQNAYEFTRTATSYNLTFCLGGQTGGYGAGVHSLTQSGIQ